MTALSVAEPRDDPGEGGGSKNTPKRGVLLLLSKTMYEKPNFWTPLPKPGLQTVGVRRARKGAPVKKGVKKGVKNGVFRRFWPFLALFGPF